MDKPYNLPETIYILYHIGTNHTYSHGGVNRIFMLQPHDTSYETNKVVAKNFQLNYIAEEAVSHELKDTKRLYLLYDTVNNRPYFDVRHGKILVAFTTHKKAKTYHERVRSATKILCCSYRERDRKVMIDEILKDLEEEGM